MLIEPRMATRSGTITEIAGPDEIRAARLVVLAALWDDDLAPQFSGRVKAHLFTDDLLRAVAAYSVGALATFGCNDLPPARRSGC